MDQVGGRSSVARILPSGVSDSSFGQGGSVVLDARVGGRVAVDVAPDGGVILAGVSGNSSSPVTTVTRLRPDGSTESEFGDAGLTTLTGLVAGAMLIQPDGRILVGGVRWPAVSASGPPVGGLVVRLDVRGRPDVSFGEDGVAMLRKDGRYGLVDFIAGLALQPGGAVVAVGSSVVATSYKGSYAFLGTVTRDGQGAHLADAGSEVFAIDKDCFEEGANALAVQPDAKVLVGGSVCEETSWVARYARDLRLDAGTPLRLHDTRPRSIRSLRASNTSSLAQLTALVRATVPAHVLVTVRRARFGENSSAVVGAGGRVWLQPGTAAGDRTLRRRSKAIAAQIDHSGRLSLRLLFSPRLFARGDLGMVTVRARDDQGRTTELEIPFVRPLFPPVSP
jgi:uncharacterized delta-60 repeat protein